MAKNIMIVDDSASLRQVAGAKAWVVKPFQPQPAQMPMAVSKLVLP